MAYNGNYYGFINKKGEVVIGYYYKEATPFNKNTGYAKVVRKRETYWLSPDGTEYAYTEDISSLPKIEKDTSKTNEQETFTKKTLDQYRVSGNKIYQLKLNEGIDLYNEGKYYDAFLRFNAVEVTGVDTKYEKIGKMLEDTAMYEIKQLFITANTALQIAENIINAFYFYDGKFALAYKNKKYGFIDKTENIKIEYKYTEALPFNWRTGLSKVKRDNKYFLIDTIGTEYLLAENVNELTSKTEALDLSYQYLTEIPDTVFNFTQLKILLLNDNKLTSLPREIENLTNLTYLNLWASQFASLSSEIGNLTNLTYLNIGMCNLISLPKEIEKLTNLTELNIEFTQLTSLPIEIGNLTNLTKLNLESNKLTSLPSEIGNLFNLTELNLENNQLTSLPSEIGSLTNLTELYLVDNQLTSLLKEIEHLTNLNYLKLSINQLTSLPKEIGNLAHLTLLGVDWKTLDSLPVEILNLNSTCFSGNDWFYMSQIFAKNNEYENAVLVWKKAIENRPDNYSYYFNLSFYSLFAGEYEQAITSAKKSLELAPEKTGVYTNLAVAYVLNNQYKLSKPIYLEWKDKHFPNDERPCKEVFLQDIADLEATGIKHKDFKKVKKLLK